MNTKKAEMKKYKWPLSLVPESVSGYANLVEMRIAAISRPAPPCPLMIACVYADGNSPPKPKRLDWSTAVATPSGRKILMTRPPA